MPQLLFTALLTLAVLQTPSLDSPSPKERQAAIQSMAVLGNRDAIPNLAGALKKESKSDLRAEIVAAFGRIRDRGAIPALTETLRTDLDKDVRLQAIDSLLRLYILIDDPGPLRTLFTRMKSVFFQVDTPVVLFENEVDAEVKSVLATTMQKDFSDDVRVEAARALGSLKARDQMPALIATLEDPQNREHNNVRLQVIQTLGRLRDPAAGPSLEKALQDRETLIVLDAAMSIGLCAYTPARPALENLYRTSGDRAVKKRSLEALSLLRDPGTVKLFESLLDHTDDFYREVSAEGLARLDYDAKGWTTRYNQEKKANVRNALAFGLASSGDDSYINNLTNALDSRQDFQVEVYLYELGKFEGKLLEIQRYLRSQNPKVRAGVARVLGNIGDKSSRDAIQPLTDDGSVEVVREAVAALRKLSQ
jgi:HEAT repeat protein